MKWRRSAIVAITIAGLAVIAASVYRYTYPLVRPDSSPVVGLVRQWWRGAALVSFDTNRDGRIDVRMLYPDSSGNFSQDRGPLETWEDLDNDGYLEVHVFFQGRTARCVEVDSDRDGRPNQTLEGSRAQNFLREHPSKR